MRRNAAGQKVQAMMRTSAAAITAVVSLAARTVSGATNATPIVVTTTAAHGMIPGNRVEITGVGGNTAANGTFVVIAVGTTTTFSLGNTTTGAAVAGNGTYTSGGTVTPQSVNVFVSKDGGAPTTGAGTLSHIGKGPFHIAHTADVNQLRALTAIPSSTTVAGATAVTVASGGINSSTYGLWSYTPTADETNAASVSFTFTAPAVGAISVTQTFEPTSGPILYQASLSATGGAVTNQTTIVLPSATPIPPADDDSFNGCMIVFYDGSTAGQMSVGVISDYVGSTRTITLREAPTFTITSSDYVTIIADPGLKSATKDRLLVVDAAGIADANVEKWNTTTVPDEYTVGYPIVTVKDGTGTGEIDTASGLVRLSAAALDDILRTALTESYATDGAAGTLSQILFGIQAFLQERSVGGTTLTTKKLDGSTTAMTFTLSDATSPTSITRAS